MQKTILGLGLLVLAPFCPATTIQVAATGTINNTNMTAFAVNQQITVTFTYEASGSPQFTANNQAFYIDRFSSVSVVSGS